MRAFQHLVAIASFTLLGLASCAEPAPPSAVTFLPSADAGAAEDAAAAPRRTPTYLPPLPLDPGMSAYDPAPECPSRLSLGAGEKLPGSTSGHEFGLSVTHDELSAAWMTEHDGAITIHYVDRVTSGESFGSPRSITGAFAAGRVALTSDGLDLAVVDAGGLGFSVLRRADRFDPFGDPEIGPFELLDEQGRDVLGPAGETYADPLFANGDRYFVFSRVAAGGGGSVQISSRFFGSAPFSPGVPFAEEALAPAGAKRKTVTGASADVRTLFFWDESVAQSSVVRLSAQGTVESSAVLGAARDVQPTGDCRVFWFTSGSPSDVMRFAAP